MGREWQGILGCANAGKVFAMPVLLALKNRIFVIGEEGGLKTR